MKDFLNYIDNEILNESLNDPFKYYITDDTDAENIFTAFDDGDFKYGVSFTRNKPKGKIKHQNKVYTLTFYRISNNKKYYWKFNKKTFAKTISTIWHIFIQTYNELLKEKMSVVILDFKGFPVTENRVKFISKIFYKFQFRRFKELSIKHDQENPKNWMIFARENISPNDLYSMEEFSGIALADEMPDESLDNLNISKKKIPPKASLKKSGRYVFTNIKLDIVVDNSFLNILDVAKMDYKQSLSTPPKVDTDTLEDVVDKADPAEVSVMKFEKLLAKTPNKDVVKVKNDIGPTIIKGKPSEEDVISMDEDGIPVVSVSFLAAYLVHDIFDVSQPFDPEKFDYNNFKDLFNRQLEYKFPPHIGEPLKKELYGNYSLGVSNALKVIKSSAKIPKSDLAVVDRALKKIQNSYTKIDNSIIKSVKKLPIPTFPASNLDGFTSSNNAVAEQNQPFLEKNEDTSKKIHSLINSTEEIKSWYDAKTDSALLAYSGNSFVSMNTEMRNSVLKNKKFNYSKLSEKNQKLIEHFAVKAPKLEHGIWVYRRTFIPDVDVLEPGDNFTDPGFMSTTIKSAFTYAAGAVNCKLKIFLPKGTIMAPLFDKSKNKSESEIVLPPYSYFRILEVYQFNNTSVLYIVALLEGQGIMDIWENKENEILLEDKNSNKNKTEVANNNNIVFDKWSHPMLNAKIAKAMKKLSDLKVINTKKKI